MNDRYLNDLYNNAKIFLINKVGEEILNNQLTPYLNKKPDSLEKIFRQMVGSLKNKQGHKNFIANIDEMSNILFEFNPYIVAEKYQNWRDLFNLFNNLFSNKYKMDISNDKNAWVMFTKGIISCTNFITKFKSFKDFDDFISTFSGNSYKIVALPMLLAAEIFGFGFALACDFLKEVGYTDYGKPDVHIKDIFEHYKIIEQRSDYETFKKITEIGILVNEKPVIVDKIFWLIGSGNFHFSNIELGILKKEFFEFYKN